MIDVSDRFDRMKAIRNLIIMLRRKTGADITELVLEGYTWTAVTPAGQIPVHQLLSEAQQAA